MNRPKYKELYQKEKSKSNLYKDFFDRLLEIMQEFDIKVFDRIDTGYSSPTKYRFIYIEKDGKKFQVAINEEYL